MRACPLRPPSGAGATASTAAAFSSPSLPPSAAAVTAADAAAAATASTGGQSAPGTGRSIPGVAPGAVIAVGAPLIRGKQMLEVGCSDVEPNALERFTAAAVVTANTAYVESTLRQQVPLPTAHGADSCRVPPR